MARAITCAMLQVELSLLAYMVALSDISATGLPPNTPNTAVASATPLQPASSAQSRPGSRLLANGSITPEQLAALAAQVVERLVSGNDPAARVLQLQVSMEQALRQQQQQVEDEQSEQQQLLQRKLQGIVQPSAKQQHSMEQYAKLHEQIFSYVCSHAGLERALNDAAAAAEVRAAMSSLFPVSSLPRLMSDAPEERRPELEELSRMTLGVCLYNQAAGSGARALPAGAQSCIPQASRLLRDIDRTIVQLGRDLEVHCGGSVVGVNLPVSGAALFTAQALAYCQSLRDDLEAGLEVAQGLDTEMQQRLAQLRASIGSSQAIPKTQIYPQFDLLGSHHAALHAELRLLVARQRIFDRLQQLLPDLGTASQQDTQTPATAQRRGSRAATGPSSSSGSCSGSSAAAPLPADVAEALPAEVEYIAPASNGKVTAKLALGGFCPVLLSGQHELKRGEQQIGALRHAEQLYVFSSHEALQQFAADPPGVLSRVHCLAAAQPALIHLLGLQADLPGADLRPLLGLMTAPLRCDFGTQTPTHFVEKHIDIDYEWNEWALRRRVISLANLRNKATHSAQTNLSNFRRDSETQIWIPKEATSQTASNKGQAMPKKLRYVAGLRGPPTAKMTVLSLELDVGQPHQF